MNPDRSRSADQDPQQLRPTSPQPSSDVAEPANAAELARSATDKGAEQVPGEMPKSGAEDRVATGPPAPAAAVPSDTSLLAAPKSLMEAEAQRVARASAATAAPAAAPGAAPAADVPEAGDVALPAEGAEVEGQVRVETDSAAQTDVSTNELTPTSEAEEPLISERTVTSLDADPDTGAPLWPPGTTVAMDVPAPAGPPLGTRPAESPPEVNQGVPAPQSQTPPQPGPFSPTSDGGPPLARPVVVVTLAVEQLRRIHEDALAAAAQRDAKTCREIAEEAVRQEFWWRDCQDRVANGDY